MSEKTALKLDPSFWLSLFFVVVIACLVVSAAHWQWDTRLFPWAIGIPALALALWQLVSDAKGSGSKLEEQETSAVGPLDIPVDSSIPPDVMLRRTLTAMGWIIAFTVGIWLLGFLVAIPIFVFLYLVYGAGAGIWGALVITCLTWLFIWGLFDYVMHLAWPEAALLTLLGF